MITNNFEYARKLLETYKKETGHDLENGFGFAHWLMDHFSENAEHGVNIENRSVVDFLAHKELYDAADLVMKSNLVSTQPALRHGEAASKKTDETSASYTYKAKSLINGYLSIAEDDDIADGEGLVEWFINTKKIGIRPATWRVYKSSLIQELEERGCHAAANRLRPASSQGTIKGRKEKRNTSSHKKKSITEMEEDALITCMLDKFSHWGMRACAFFRASLMTGLRPIEWKNAALIEKQNAAGDQLIYLLKVKNAKNTNGRAHGEFRHLDLSEFNEDDMRVIKRQLMYVNPEAEGGLIGINQNKMTYDGYYCQVASFFGRAVDQCFPSKNDPGRTIAMYSCRHQFSANLKLSGASLAEVAAILGHGADDTASEPYAKKKVERRGTRFPRAVPEETARIKKNNGASHQTIYFHRTQ